MKSVKICMCIMGISMSVLTAGCDQIQAIKDKVSDPEDIVVDYVMHITDIMNSTTQCDELQAKLEAYCPKREAVVTQAVKETVERVKGGKITSEKQDEIVEKLKKISEGNFTSCLLTPGVTVAKMSCLKPVLGISF